MKPQQYIAKLEKIKNLNTKFKLFSFELVNPHRLEFQAGQYISFEVEKGVRRSYSIASSPDIKHGFEVLIDLSNPGKGADFFKSLVVGQEVNFLAPLGNFVLKNLEKNNPIVFVATGSGVAPFRSMILDLLQKRQDKRSMELYWGLRHDEHLCLLEDWTELMKAFPNFRFHPVLSKAPQQWSLCRGRVTDCLSVHKLDPLADFYLCGRKTMIEEVVEILTKRGINQSKIIFEKYD
jgi:NAD(P)H-flavin reductase